jgi:hypothetical protein
MYLFLVALLTTTAARAQPALAQHPQHTAVTNDALINSLLQRVSYARLVAAHYPKAPTSPPLGSGRMVSFAHGPNQFTCFKSSDNTFTASFVVSSPEPLLAPTLTLGRTKSATLNQLGVPRSCDILQVANREGMALATLYFQQDKLVKVTFGVTMD